VLAGTGGVSMSGLQIGTAMGARVIVTSSSDEKLKIAQGLGAKPEYCINYKTTPDWDEEVMRITKGRGVDHILEVSCYRVMSAHSLSHDYRCKDWWWTNSPQVIIIRCCRRMHPYYRYALAGSRVLQWRLISTYRLGCWL